MTDTSIFARRNDAGDFSILDAEGRPVTRLSSGEYPSVYPVGSELGAGYEHAEGIVLDEASVMECEIDFEDGYRIDTPEASYTYPVRTEEAALDRFANTVGYDDYASLALTLNKSVDEAKADLVITRT
jgi:hypothetical protein